MIAITVFLANVLADFICFGLLQIAVVWLVAGAHTLYCRKRAQRAAAAEGGAS